MKIYLSLLVVSSLLLACGPRQSSPGSATGSVINPYPSFANAVATQNSSAERGVTNSRYTYNADNTELNIIIDQSSGEEMTLQLIRRPLGGSVVTVQTIIKEQGQVSSRYRTTPGEAQLAIKLAANNGWRSVHSDLKERYEQAGLL